MRHPINCAVVTLSTGVEATFMHADADEFVKGELTITDRVTHSEHLFPPGSWTGVTVYDHRGYYVYAIDLDVRVRIIQLPPVHSQPSAV